MVRGRPRTVSNPQRRIHQSRSFRPQVVLPPGAPALVRCLAQSLADMAGAFDIISEMRIVPIAKHQLLLIAGAHAEVPTSAPAAARRLRRNSIAAASRSGTSTSA